jgi:hypothetical protein
MSATSSAGPLTGSACCNLARSAKVSDATGHSRGAFGSTVVHRDRYFRNIITRTSGQRPRGLSRCWRARDRGAR